jgi:hypothetical protein
LIVWNALGDLLDYLGWNQTLLQLGRLDVSTNEVFLEDNGDGDSGGGGLPFAFRSPNLPAIYYLGPTTTSNGVPVAPVIVPYNGPDGMSDPLDIIEWWLDIVSMDNNDDDSSSMIDESELLQALEASSAASKKEQEKETVHDE